MGDRTRAGLRQRLALLAGLSPLLCAAPALAEPFQVGGAGVFVGYAFGEGGGVQWGLEGFATRYLEQHSFCEGPRERHGVGPLLRVSAVGVSRLELTLAAHGGGDLPDMRVYGAVDGELGASLFLGSGTGLRVAPHSGILVESIIFNAYFRQAWLIGQDAIEPELSLGFGARYWPTFGESGVCVEGRPFRGCRGEPQRARVHLGRGFDGRHERARIWAKRAAEECASVPAFLQLALELLDLDAPPHLVTSAVAAADEELGHTRAALQLAEAFGGAEVKLTPPPFRRRPVLARRPALERLAREAFRDGCVNEGWAASIAAADAEGSRVAAEARVSARIAREEAGHAALGGQVLAWALAELA